MAKLLRKAPLPIGCRGRRDDVLSILSRHISRRYRSINVVIAWDDKYSFERTFRNHSKLLYPLPSSCILVRCSFESNVATDENRADRSKHPNLFDEITHHTCTDRGVRILLGNQTLRRSKVDVRDM